MAGDSALGQTSNVCGSNTNGIMDSVLEALKEEIFQLEVEHKQGHISQQEYEKAKAALDQTLELAVKRGARTSSPVG